MAWHEGKHRHRQVGGLHPRLCVEEGHDVERAPLMYQACVQSQGQVANQQEHDQKTPLAARQRRHERRGWRTPSPRWRRTIIDLDLGVIGVCVGGVAHVLRVVTELRDIETAQVHRQGQDGEQEAKLLVT